MASKPTIVLLHGAWHNPIHYERLMALLSARGYSAHCPLQPSFNAIPATKTLYEDAEYIRTLLEKLVKEGKDVVVVGHS